MNGMIPHINIFVSRFGNGITGHKNKALIIAANLYRTKIVTKFNKNRADPNTLATTI